MRLRQALGAIVAKKGDFKRGNLTTRRIQLIESPQNSRILLAVLSASTGKAGSGQSIAIGGETAGSTPDGTSVLLLWGAA